MNQKEIDDEVEQLLNELGKSNVEVGVEVLTLKEG